MTVRDIVDICGSFTQISICNRETEERLYTKFVDGFDLDTYGRCKVKQIRVDRNRMLELYI